MELLKNLIDNLHLHVGCCLVDHTPRCWRGWRGWARTWAGGCKWYPDWKRWDLWCPDMGESGVEIDNNEAGSGVIVPDHKVNCSPSEVFFLIFLDFLGVNFCCIINSGGPGGPEAEVNPGPGWPDLTFCLEIRIRIHQHASSLLTFYFDLRPSCWTGITKDSGWCKSRK